MAFDNREVATKARILITEKSPSSGINFTLPRLVGMIPSALELWTRVNLAYEERRKLFLTEVTTSNASSGVVDLTPYTDGTTNNIPLEEICRPDVVIYSNSRDPMHKVDRYVHLQSAMFSATNPSCFIEGFNLRIRNTDGSLTTYASPVIFTAAEYPIVVADIHARLRESFISFLARLALKELNLTELEQEAAHGGG